MALSYQEVAQHPRRLLALTGYTQQEFVALLPYFVKEFTATMTITTLQNTPRQVRAYGAYENSPLPTMEDKLFFILVYLKQAPTQEVQGALFGIYQPEAHRWIHLLHGVVNQALAAAQELPARTTAAWQATAPQAGTYFHDGTERSIPRPRKADKQVEMSSGKKKRHTVKNNVVGDTHQKVVLLTETCEGKRHDKRIADEAAYTLPKDSTLYQDTGFQGLTMTGVTIKQPKKSREGTS
jgi:hypothetical protein